MKRTPPHREPKSSSMQRRVESGPDARPSLDALRWWALALASLATSGLLAGTVAFARVPPFHTWFADGTLFRRLLVVHVDLALVVWLMAVLVAVHASVHVLRARRRVALLGTVGLGAAAGGVVAMLAAALTRAAPVMSNYIPVLHHPLFVLGLASVVAGVFAALVALSVSALGARAGLEAPAILARASAVTFFAATACAGIAALTVSRGLDLRPYWEQIMWGGGHLLQGAYFAAMLAIWALLAARLGAPFDHRLARVLAVAIAVPALATPLLYALGPTHALAIDGFTYWMRWAITPVALAGLVALVRSVRSARVGDADPLSHATRAVLAGSGVLLVAGIALGFLIRGSNTVIPAHYHASIGAVTLAAMGLGLRVFTERGWLPWRAIRWQPVVFASGQLVFAVGFALCGADGMPRKVFGAQQHVITPLQTAGLVTMGLGGLGALVGGIWFLAAAAGWARTEWSRRRRSVADVRPVPPPHPLTANALRGGGR